MTVQHPPSPDPSHDRVTLRRPDDWHVHLRDGAMLEAVLDYTARQFARAIVMPNLSPPVTTAAAARAYAGRITAALKPGRVFTPLMTCYLTDDARPDDLEDGFASGAWVAAKLYPAHATTNASHGVTDLQRILPALERMQQLGMPLLVHGEVTDPHVDIFDREAEFIDRVLSPLLDRMPELRVVFEHITTEQAVQFVQSRTTNLAATITAHHLLINRNAMFQDGLRPHHYCLPVAKRERHRLALRRAAISGDSRFFLGTDTAPHAVTAKESACGCAGIFSAPTALELYAEVFDEEGALDRLEGFASLHGPAFYRMPVNDETVTLVREAQAVPERIAAAGTEIVPFRAGGSVRWRLMD